MKTTKSGAPITLKGKASHVAYTTYLDIAEQWSWPHLHEDFPGHFISNTVELRLVSTWLPK
jgi:hypothetical protein